MLKKNFLSDNFNFKDTLFWQTKMYTDTKEKTGNKDLKESQNSYAYDLLYEQYGYLLEMFFEEQTDKNKLAQAIMIEIFVRCGLVLADEEVADSFILMMKSEISYLEENNIHNDKAKEFIFNAFSHIDEDKSLPNILSFRL